MIGKIRLLILFVMAILILPAYSCDRKKGKDAVSEEVPGVSDTEIKIGSSLALSGHAGYLGIQTLHGAMAYINYINEKGGVHGRKIKLVVKDDQYDPPKCLVNTQQLIIEDKVFCLFSYVGTPTTVKVVPLFEEAKIPMVGAFTGANGLREPFNRYVINIRASYYQETEAALKHLINDLGIRKIAVFYQYDAYGFDGLKGAELALQKYNLTPLARGQYVRGTLDIEEGLHKIMDTDAEAVVMIGTYEPCAKFINMVREKGANPIFYMVSFVGANEIARRVSLDDSVIIMSQVVPPPEEPETQTLLWGAVEYTTLSKRWFPDDTPNFVGMEGYLNAKVLVEGLQRAGKNLTREGFIDAVESIRDYSLGIANTLNFSPKNHQGLERVYLTRLQNGKFTLITDWEKIKKDWHASHIQARERMPVENGSEANASSSVNKAVILPGPGDKPADATHEAPADVKPEASRNKTSKPDYRSPVSLPPSANATIRPTNSTGQGNVKR